MISALNMELEIVRTVFRNDAGEVSVYADAKRDTGTYYTVISILSKTTAKEILERMAVWGLFAQNGDFIGSFTYRDALCLVFAHHAESRLANKEALYASDFVKRKEIALGVLTALAETDIRGDIGKLLITEDNVNITPDGKVYLNYFLDFSRFSTSYALDDFYRDAARFAFDILSREYAAKYEKDVEHYPNELRLMYKKIESKSFKSYSQILTFVKALPDKPKERRFGVMRLLDTAESFRGFLMKKPANLLLAVVVAITLVYLGYQLTIRAIDNKNRSDNTVYVGMQTIGEIYLGEENI